MKMRNKGKVHPFTSSAASLSSFSSSAAGAAVTSSPSSANKDHLDVLKLLPAAIFTLISVLSVEDSEVLAYLVTRSLKTTNPSFLPAEDKKKSSKKRSLDGHGDKSTPLFDCGCFDCYTSYWCRWDASPHHELINQAIEAFEEHLNNGEQVKKSPPSGKNRKKERMGRRKNEKISAESSGVLEFPAVESAENQESSDAVVAESEAADEKVNDVNPDNEEQDAEGSPENESAADTPAAVVRSHKGFARKVLPDFMGIFSSRLWSLWSPKV
ncbi:hypothetical protein CDL12_21118 [Handroanthus impetiginosus]|uniref:Uncharacterized protein n=1 Tax=Handroanthus impetiginosus TaxID=429701 RepID=A0A2G9GLZ6_9LAMI|nr:hypothetical protein CDL12_21118 [Handroanthus impetiginosus]